MSFYSLHTNAGMIATSVVATVTDDRVDTVIEKRLIEVDRVA